MREYTVEAGPGGRESGEAGYGLQGDRQDLKAKERLVRGYGASRCRPTGFVDTHPHPAPAVGCGTPAQAPAASEGWWTPYAPAAPPSTRRSSD